MYLRCLCLPAQFMNRLSKASLRNSRLEIYCISLKTCSLVHPATPMLLPLSYLDVCVLPLLRSDIEERTLRAALGTLRLIITAERMIPCDEERVGEGKCRSILSSHRVWDLPVDKLLNGLCSILASGRQCMQPDTVDTVILTLNTVVAAVTVGLKRIEKFVEEFGKGTERWNALVACLFRIRSVTANFGWEIQTRLASIFVQYNSLNIPELSDSLHSTLTISPSSVSLDISSLWNFACEQFESRSEFDDIPVDCNDSENGENSSK
eukprot:89970_1